MRTVLVLFLAAAALAACTKPNPNTCCVTDQQCADLGADELRPCAAGQACGPEFTCVAAECQNSADCTDPLAPICQLGLCVGTCATDTDCADVAGRPYCADDGVCVGCMDASQCPADASICDTDTRACRGCERDDECASGVCIEADGVCANESEILFVGTNGADTGACTRSAPCATVSFALGHVTKSRSIIRLSGGNLYETSTITVDRTVTIDADGTEFYRPSTGPAFAVTQGTLMLEGLLLTSSSRLDPIVTVGSSAKLRLARSHFEAALFEASGGSIEVQRTTSQGGRFSCANGTIELFDNVFDDGAVTYSNCQVTVERNRFERSFDGSINGGGGSLRVVNNIFLVPSEFVDLIRIGTVSTGSLFAFNTIVNTTTISMSPVALSCTGGPVRMTSNVIAYNSTNPVEGCVVEHSVFDTPSGSDATGNIVADAATLFVDRAASDFRLAPQSPALHVGEAGLVSTDLSGAIRPAPAGSDPDAGAFESTE